MTIQQVDQIKDIHQKLARHEKSLITNSKETAMASVRSQAVTTRGGNLVNMKDYDAKLESV